MPAGRPSEFTQEKADYICRELAEGRSLRSICEEKGTPNITTIFYWLRNYPEFSKQYAEAREMQMERMAEEILQIADDADRDTIIKKGKSGEEYEAMNSEWVQRSKLRVDTRKWLMSKMAPKKFGEKVSQEISGADGSPLSVNLIINRKNVDD